uniref:Signal transducer and activator of transcription n=1 Tax=Strigamia maritima TaxID=126957 RepID=T1JJU0_STRMM
MGLHQENRYCGSEMSLWTKAQQLQGDALRQVQAVYGDHFPIEVRHFLAPWIEEKTWQNIDPDNPAHEGYAAGLVASLIQELEAKAQQMNSAEFFLMKLKLSETANMFRQHYSHNPLSLVRIVRHCLNMETKLVEQAENPPVGSGMANQIHSTLDPQQEITQQLEYARRKTHETEEELRRMQNEQESFVIQYQESSKLQAHINQVRGQPNGQTQVETEKKLQKQKEMVDQMLSQKATGLLQMRLALAEKHNETFQILNGLQSKVLDEELIRWKREQQLAGNGAPFNNNLDTIQEWCEALAEVIWQNRQQIKRVELLRAQLPIDPPGGVDLLPGLNSQITGLLSSLVTSTFIIEKQPPQVMKTNTRFTATVRLLVGGKLNVHMTPPQVKVTIISEAQANALLKNDKMAKGDASGEILNNNGTMEYHQATRQLSVSFRNMQLRKIKRAEKKGTESVMDEKFSLLFQSQFNVGGGELVFQVWTLSLPVVVIVHGNQEPHAWATVSWDNAFAEPGRVPFAVPEKVPWQQVAEMLVCKFKAATGRGLSDDNLRYLGGKAFRSNTQIQEYANMMLSWSQFCKETIPDRTFTFWEWFYAIMKLTREHLRGLWNDGHILGFLGRKQTEEMLLSKCKGTFLLRFSDSELGGVTFAWCNSEGQNPEQKEVLMLQPFSNKDFAIRSLADRANDMGFLQYLFPDVAKDKAFSKYYTPMTENATNFNGYVKPVLRTHVPGVEENGMESYPSTPQQLQPQSPDTGYLRDTPSVNSNASEHMTDQHYM